MKHAAWWVWNHTGLLLQIVGATSVGLSMADATVRRARLKFPNSYLLKYLDLALGYGVGFLGKIIEFLDKYVAFSRQRSLNVPGVNQ